MGAVWVADHLALRTQVVVKFIASSLKDSKEATERFSREAAAASQVKSPHVVQTFDHGFTADGVPYIVMELLEGRDLGELIDKQGPLEPHLVVEIVAQLSRALDRAHQRGIVHRDIKPGNIFLCDGDHGNVFVKLLDFGIAKGVDTPALDSGTKTGAMIGSPFYMSPEQILGSKTIDHRSDLWSVGVVAYEALTGKKPFDAETMGGLAIRIHSDPLPNPSRVAPGLPPSVDAWYHRACARSSADRFTTCKEMAESLAAALGGEMPHSVASPRVGTGSSAASKEAQLIAGATTEAGIVRPASNGNTTRNRLLALLAFGVALSLATFAGVSFMRGSEPRSARTTAEPPPPSAPPSATSPPPPASTLVVVPPPPADSAPAVASAHPVTTKPGHHPHGTGRPPASSPSTRPPVPSATAAPAPTPTGHDIF